MGVLDSLIIVGAKFKPYLKGNIHYHNKQWLRYLGVSNKMIRIIMISLPSAYFEAALRSSC